MFTLKEGQRGCHVGLNDGHMFTSRQRVGVSTPPPPALNLSSIQASVLRIRCRLRDKTPIPCFTPISNPSEPRLSTLATSLPLNQTAPVASPCLIVKPGELHRRQTISDVAYSAQKHGQ